MAKEFRIDKVTIGADGKVTRFYTIGETPLPVAPSGTAETFADWAAYADAQEAAQDALPDRVGLAMAGAPVYKNNSSPSSATLYTGKSAQLDLSGAVQPIVLK